MQVRCYVSQNTQPSTSYYGTHVRTHDHQTCISFFSLVYLSCASLRSFVASGLVVDMSVLAGLHQIRYKLPAQHSRFSHTGSPNPSCPQPKKKSLKANNNSHHSILSCYNRAMCKEQWGSWTLIRLVRFACLLKAERSWKLSCLLCLEQQLFSITCMIARAQWEIGKWVALPHFFLHETTVSPSYVIYKSPSPHPTIAHRTALVIRTTYSQQVPFHDPVINPNVSSSPVPSACEIGLSISTPSSKSAGAGKLCTVFLALAAGTCG